MRARLKKVDIAMPGWDDLLQVECYYTPGTPGRLSGPPEDCYPAEGPEIEIQYIRTERGNLAPHEVRRLMDDDLLYERIQEAIESQAELEPDFCHPGNDF